LRRQSLKVLEFRGIHFKEEHFYALSTVQRTDLEFTYTECTLEPRDAQNISIDWFRHYEVVTKLDSFDMESSFLSALINGNTSVKSLYVATETCDVGEENSMCFLRTFDEEDVRSLAQVLPGLWVLKIYHVDPRIKCLSITLNNRFVSFSAESKATVMNAILQMHHLNTVVQTMNLPDPFIDEPVYQNSILPRLEMNRSCFEVQRQAVKRADPSIRPQLLGRAWHAHAPT
jgi:hypothetical protein